jgi:hypothetical protein
MRILRNEIYMLGNDMENDDAIKKQTIKFRMFLHIIHINLRICVLHCIVSTER